MVGVPGRSKGCNTCRRRRILCSLEKPQCHQCIKSNRLCAGYQRERVFIVSQGPVDKRLPVRGKTPVKAATLELEPCAKSVDALSLSRKKDAQGNPSRVVTTRIPLGSEVLPKSAYRQQLVSAFLCCYLPVARLVSFEDKPWLLLLPDLPEPTAALDMSFLAVATAKLGRINNDPVLVQESLRLYSKGLWELQKALWDPALMYRDETLAACMTLVLYEIMECPGQSKNGYISHCNGCATLIRLRGVDMCVSGLGHKLFLAFRFQAVLQALENHRAVFLSEPSWSVLPWRLCPKLPFDRLLDLLLLAPNILKQADRLKDLRSLELLLSTLHIIHQCWQLDVDLQQLYDDLQKIALGPLYWPEFATEDNATDDPELGKLFPVAFHFPNLRIARTVILYWATIVMLWPGMTALYGIIPFIHLDPTESDIVSKEDSWDDIVEKMGNDYVCDREEALHTPGSSQFDMTQLQPLGERVDHMPFIRNICQSVEYCMQENMLGQGPSIIAAPLDIVIEALERLPGQNRELMWARAELDKIRGTGLLILKKYDTTE